MAVVGMLAVGPDAAFLRTQVVNGGTTAIIGCWRYILLFFANVIVASILGGGPRVLVSGARSSPLAISGAVLIIFCINVGFTVSLLFVDAAKALLLISINPLWAAMQGTLLLGDALHTHTVVAQVVSLAAMFLVFMPELLSILNPEDPVEGEDNPKVALLDVLDLVPLATGFMVATLITYSRWQASASLELAPALGAAVTAVVALTKLIIVDGEPAAGLVTGLRPMFWVSLFCAALSSALYDLALVIAPRTLTSAEVALILLGEVVFGPLWVWVGYGDVPDTWTLIGGGLLLVALIGHEAASLMLEKAAEHEGGHVGNVGVRETLAYAAFGSDLQFSLGSHHSSSSSLGVPRSHSATPSSLASIGAHRSPLLDRSARRSRDGSRTASRAASLDSDKQAALLAALEGTMEYSESMRRGIARVPTV